MTYSTVELETIEEAAWLIHREQPTEDRLLAAQYASRNVRRQTKAERDETNETAPTDEAREDRWASENEAIDDGYGEDHGGY
jgi:hypothetical protein